MPPATFYIWSNNLLKSVQLNMFKILSGRASINDGFSADDYDALGAQPFGKLVTELFGVAFGIFENRDLDEFARIEAIRKAFEHIFAYTLLADLPDRLNVRGESL